MINGFVSVKQRIFSINTIQTQFIIKSIVTPSQSMCDGWINEYGLEIGFSTEFPLFINFNIETVQYDDVCGGYFRKMELLFEAT